MDEGCDKSDSVILFKCEFRLVVPFIVKLQSVFRVQRGYELPDHSLRFLPLIPSQHPDMSHQPRHCTDRHAAHFPFDVVSDLLRSREMIVIRKEEGKMWSEIC